MVRATSLTLIVLLSALASSDLHPRAELSRAATERVRLVPHFVPGETLHYQFEIRTHTASHSTGPILNPEAASQLELSATALVRLDVLSVEGDAPGGTAGRIRLRTTYEKAVATSGSDAYDPLQSAIEEQYQKLQGNSIEFTIEPDGSVGDITGLKEILPEQAAAGAVRDWLSGLAAGTSFPRQGIAIGQKWSAERPVPDAPLAGIVWRAESSYLRNEPCRSPIAVAPGEETATPEETCAIILTRFQMTQRGSPRDATPEEYRRKGLRTSGKWTGSGESLNSISLRTGLVVNVTQTGLEEMDFTVSTADGSSHIHYAGRVQTQSQITLLPEAPPAPK